MSSQVTISAKAFSRIDDMASFIHSGAVYLLQGERPSQRGAMEELIGRFAIRGPVRVVAGGNWVSFDRLPILLRERQGRVYEVLDHILISRAEVCYQMVDVLTALKADPIPLIICDMLDAFYDEDLTEQEVGRLLQKCLRRIETLSQQAPVLIGISSDRRRPELAQAVEEIADMRIYLESGKPMPDLQMSMGF